MKTWQAVGFSLAGNESFQQYPLTAARTGQVGWSVFHALGQGANMMDFKKVLGMSCEQFVHATIQKPLEIYYLIQGNSIAAGLFLEDGVLGFVAEVLELQSQTETSSGFAGNESVVVLADIHDLETLVADRHPQKHLKRIKRGGTIFGNYRKPTFGFTLREEQFLGILARLHADHQLRAKVTMEIHYPLHGHIDQHFPVFLVRDH